MAHSKSFRMVGITLLGLVLLMTATLAQPEITHPEQPAQQPAEVPPEVLKEKMEALQKLLQERDWAQALQAELAALKAQGMPLTLAEAAPKPVPDDLNAASLYSEAFDIIGAEKKGVWNDWALLGRYLHNPTPEIERQFAAALDRPAVRLALDLLRLGSQRPYCVLPVNLKDDTDKVFSYMAKFREAGRLLAGRALLSARENRIEEALHWSQVSLRMSQHASSAAPSLITQLGSWATQSITLRYVKEYLSAAEVPPETAIKFEEYLRQVDLYQGFHHAMIGERAFGLEASEKFVETFGKEAKIAQAAHSLFLVGYLQGMKKIIEIGKLSYRVAQPQMEALEQEAKGDMKYSLVDSLISTLKHAMRKRDYPIAEIGMCRVVLALKAHRYRHHTYPKTLAELQKTLDWPLPQDSFTGKDFIYRRQGDGFIVYSIGQDLEDDGGLPERDEQGKWRQDADIVWQCVQ